jgi:predicted nucleic acid-binding protein
MSFYLDTNVLYAFLFKDLHSQQIDLWLRGQLAPMVVGDWGKIEFYALVGRRVRGGALTADAAVQGIADFDAFLSTVAQTAPLSSSTGALAVDLARDPILKLSAADALHLAAAADGGHVLVSFDRRLTDAARLRAYPFETP